MEEKNLEKALKILKGWSAQKVKAEDSFLKALRSNIREEIMFPEMEKLLNAISFEYCFNPFTDNSILAKVKIGDKSLGEVEMLTITADNKEVIPRTFAINSPPVIEVLENILENFFVLLAVVHTLQQRRN